MPESFADAGPDYLQQLLDAAIRAPAAPDDPACGRITANILVALADKSEDGRVEPYLSWGPGRRTSYEVRYFDPAEQLLSSTRYAGAGEAIRATGAVAGQPGNTARVVAIADDGEERWMMAVRAGAAVYRVPAEPDRADAPVTATEVVDALRQLLAEMTVNVDVDATAIEEVVRNAVAGLGRAPVPANGSGAADPAAADALVRAVVSQLAAMIPSADDIAAEVTRRMSPAPVPPAAHAPERGVRPERRPRARSSRYPAMDPAVEDALAEEGQSDATPPAGGGPTSPPGRPRPSLPPPRLPAPSPVDP